ncbi:MAG: glycosyltransferase family 9 protein [Acidobacteria bacterium]|nr:glycosyltransferase family 9 protein [Acidobacteriota bacterium]
MARIGRELLLEGLAAGALPEVWIRWPRQLGDLMFALPFFGALREDWDAAASAAGHRLRWIAVGHAIGAALFGEADPAFMAESHIESGGQGKPDPWHLLRRWRKERPAAVINLSQSVRLALGGWMAGVPLRAGIADNRLGLLYTHAFRYRDLPIHLANRYAPLLEQLTGSRDMRWMPVGPDQLGGRAGLDKLRAAGWDGRPFVGLAFGTRGYNKRWFPERETWPALARLLQAQGLDAVWLGGPDEAELGRELAALAPGSHDLTGRTSLPEALAIQHEAYGNVAVDTGLAHTAAATGRPLAALMGGSPDHLIAPVGPRVALLRGSAVDNRPGESEGFDTVGSSAHRTSPLRVLNALHALAREARGEALEPVP